MNIVEGTQNSQHKHYIAPMESLLSALNSATGKEIELQPSFSPFSEAADTDYTSYKLHERNSSVDRNLIILIDGLEYAVDRFGGWSFRSETATRIKTEIESFWRGGNTERVRTTYIPERSGL